MTEIPTEPKEILKVTRRAVMPYLRQIVGRRRVILPRIEVEKRWLDYYDKLAKTRSLKPLERRRLEEHLKTLGVYESRIELLRAAGRYARRKRALDLANLRLAQKAYYEARALTLPPEERREMLEKMLPARREYEEIERLKTDIEAKCKRFKAVKYREPPYTLISTVDRSIELKVIGDSLKSDYEEVYERGKARETLSELAEEWKGMKEIGW